MTRRKETPVPFEKRFICTINAGNEYYVKVNRISTRGRQKKLSLEIWQNDGLKYNEVLCRLSYDQQEEFLANLRENLQGFQSENYQTVADRLDVIYRIIIGTKDTVKNINSGDEVYR